MQTKPTPRIARPNLSQRNGLWHWRCLNTWGELIEGTARGAHKSKEAAHAAATKEAKRFNLSQAKL